MLEILARLKPGAHNSTHLLLAAILWSAVGTLLISRGGLWLWQAQFILLVLPALLFGTLKSRFILDRVAHKSITRILLLKDGTCLGAVYSKKTWLLVLMMIVMGRLLRQSALPKPLIGLLYITVGWALIWSSRHAWRAWCDHSF